MTTTPTGSLFTVTWAKDTAERAVKTFAQSLLGVIGLGAVDVLNLDWGDTFTTAGVTTALSVLSSIVSAGVGARGTASTTDAVFPNPTGRHAAPNA